MMTSPTPGYIQEIKDVSWVQEIIMETFDGALELLGANCVIYGGAVRDCLAGLDLLGDLDIAVPQPYFPTISNSFQTSTRWAPKSESGGILPPGFGTPPEEKKWSPFKKKNSGDLARANAPMSAVTAFRGMAGREVQLITSKQHTKDPFQDAIYVARMVDIICCGVVMAADGRVFEVVPGAYQDCKDRVLRINNASDTIFVEALPHRVEKLVNRGWKNTINVEKALREVKLAQERLKKKQERQMLSMRHKMAKPTISAGRIDTETTLSAFGDVVQEYLINVKPQEPSVRDGGYTSEIKQNIIEALFGEQSSFSLVELVSDICHQIGINARLKWTPIGKVYVTAEDYDKCMRITRELQILYMKTKKEQKKSSEVHFRHGGTVTGRISTSIGKAKRVAKPTTFRPFDEAIKYSKATDYAKAYGMATEFSDSPVYDTGAKYAMPEKGAMEEVVLKHTVAGEDTVELHLALPVGQAKSIKSAWKVMNESGRSDLISKLTENAERIEINE